MNLKQINNLTELFFNQFNQQTDKEKTLLSTLGDKKKIIHGKKLLILLI